MAGIGFEIQKYLDKKNYLGLLGAYGYAGVICSGPWILSIITILVISSLGKLYGLPLQESLIFQTIIVYLIAGSLILSAPFQHSYTRYIADQLYFKRIEYLVPSLNSIYLFLLIISGAGGAILVALLIPNLALTIQTIIISTFVVMTLIWVTVSVLSGMIAYRAIFVAFFISFICAVFAAYFLRTFGLMGLLLSFGMGQFILLLILIYTIYRRYPSDQIINFDFFTTNYTHKPLIFTGLFYNLAIWIDKFIFWYAPLTGMKIVDHLNASLIYDTPIFLAYLAMIPGMAVFLLHVETSYAQAYEELYALILGNGTFTEVQAAYEHLIAMARNAIFSAIRAQAYILLIALTAGLLIFQWLNVAVIYLPIFFVCLLAAGLNVVFWAALDVIFYLDKIKYALFLTFLFFASNAIFTWISIYLGIYFFGFGLLFSLLLTLFCSFLSLNKTLPPLLYETYMLV
jgi:polysaccharide biosynthesis protein PelG